MQQFMDKQEFIDLLELYEEEQICFNLFNDVLEIGVADNPEITVINRIQF